MESASVAGGPDDTHKPDYLLKIMGDELISVKNDGGRLYHELELHLYKAMKRHRRSLDALIKAMVEAMVNAREETKTFWDTKHPEKDYYKPFIHMVQSALKVAKERPLDEKEFSGLQEERDLGLLFLVRDRSTLNIYGDSNIKRDGVGIADLDKPETKQYVFWTDCIYEAKRGSELLHEAIRQTATYARLIFSHQANRTFAQGLLHMCPNLLYFARFDRAGCTYQKTPMDIFQEDGLRKFSHILVSMLMLPPIYSGIDQTMSPDGSCFTLHDYVCKVQSTLTYREDRATCACLVQASKRSQAHGEMERVSHTTIELAVPEPGNECKAERELRQVPPSIGDGWDACEEVGVVRRLSRESEKQTAFRVPSVLPLPSHPERKLEQAALAEKLRTSCGCTKKKRSIASVDGESEGSVAKKERIGPSDKDGREFMKRAFKKEWDALFVPVENFDERHSNENFIVKESYVLNYGQDNEDREGNAIRDIRKVHDLLKQEVGNDGIGSGPLLSSLCDYGSRVPIKDIGYVDGTSALRERSIGTAAEGSSYGDNEGKGKIATDKSGDPNSRTIERGNVPTGVVDISTTLLNPNTLEARTLVRQVIYSVGKPLVHAKSPQELLGAIEGILYGQWNLHEMGLMHRDISVGNCFITDKHKGVILDECTRNERNELTGAKILSYRESLGLVADMDRAVLIKDNSRPIRHHRTGTLPFMARYLCEHEDARHSPVQDCESTFWLLVWAIAYIALEKTDDAEIKKRIENDIIGRLRPKEWTLTQSAIEKKVLLAYFRAPRLSDLPAPFHPFVSLLKEMAKAVTQYHYASESNHKSGEIFTPEYVRECITGYLKLIHDNPVAVTSWDYMKEGEKGKNNLEVEVMKGGGRTFFQQLR